MAHLPSLIQKLRKDYKNSRLMEDELRGTPFLQFEKWLQQAVDAQIPDPNAFTLSTVSMDGKPSSRVVLLREFQEEKFCFYTNYTSRKSEYLAKNPYAAINFFWPELERQVRIEGTAAKVSAEQSDEYFMSRPRESQIGAWASGQSHVIKNRKELEDNVKLYEEKFKDQQVPRPSHWGGFCVKPHYYEFWQGRANRLHDRFAYTLKEDGSWRIERLAP